MASIAKVSLLSALLAAAARLGAAEPAPADPWAVDFRYAPPWWQTSICLPDDWQKTLVGKEGTLLYDYPGKYSGFATRLGLEYGEGCQWLNQELLSPRIPIVRTFKRLGTVQITEEAFAVAPPLPAAPPSGGRGLVVERVGSQTGERGWASPPAGSDPAFRNAAIGWGQPVQYRFKARPQARYTVLFGLCEGHHQQPGQRVLDLQVEGKTVRTVDVTAEKGRNVPLLLGFDAQDQNGDGWIDLAVAAAAGSRDANTILNLLWVFPQGEAPAAADLLAGHSPRAPSAHVDCGADDVPGGTPRHDLLLVRLHNRGATATDVTPWLTIASQAPCTAEPGGHSARLGNQTTLFSPQAWASCQTNTDGLSLVFPKSTLAPGQSVVLVVGVARGSLARPFPANVAAAEAARAAARRYWERADLPYGQLEVPDAGVQALVDAAIRNIYQAREIKKGLPAFQVGPTCYRGLWVVDGSFLLEAVSYLGRTKETRSGVKYLMSFQRPDGGFMLIDGHWKETGIALWAIARHARLTGDRAWLRGVWPQFERGFAFIGKMRQMPAADAPNARLIPDGFSDGGLADQVPEYTNIYWTLAGMRAAVEAARWLGFEAQAEAWQREYTDFLGTFRRAADRDARNDDHGNRYVPIRMRHDPRIPPQKAQWAFLHAVFPGKVFAADDPLVRGNMAMLRAVEAQGLVFDTGWLKDGVWNYFASFYAHAWLWLGDHDKAARTLYAFGNHASPLMVWREEQMPVGKGDARVGDMPHNWASAEFIRLVRHCLVLERGEDLHLFEGVPAKWLAPGATIHLRGIETQFGPISLEFRVANDGHSATLDLSPPRRSPPARLILHTGEWDPGAPTMELPLRPHITLKLRR